MGIDNAFNTNDAPKQALKLPEVGVPLFWPFGLALGAMSAGAETAPRNLHFLNEA